MTSLTELLALEGVICIYCVLFVSLGTVYVIVLNRKNDSDYNEIQQWIDFGLTFFSILSIVLILLMNTFQ